MVFATVLTGLMSVILTLALAPAIGMPALPAATLIAGILFNYRVNFYEGTRLMKRLTTGP